MDLLSIRKSIPFSFACNTSGPSTATPLTYTKPTSTNHPFSCCAELLLPDEKNGQYFLCLCLYCRGSGYIAISYSAKMPQPQLNATNSSILNVLQTLFRP